jgi:N-acetylglucosamine kinase-like BadF-type ATPase
MNAYIGIDGGGTKTEGVLVAVDGREIARAVSGPSNLHAVGLKATATSLEAVLDQLRQAARSAGVEACAVGLGMAGAARPGDRRALHALLSDIPGLPQVTITHDAEAALVGGLGCRCGVVLIAGTGAIAYGVNERGESYRADGWGSLLGDEGGGYWIGREGLRAAVRACDGRGPPTALRDLVLSRYGATDVHGLVRVVYEEGFGVPQVAAAAQWVSQAADEGDRVACDILEAAARGLSLTLSAVVRGLEMAEEPLEVVFTGGLLRDRGPLWQAVAGAMAGFAPGARAMPPRHDAAYGAALLAQAMEGTQ